MPNAFSCTHRCFRCRAVFDGIWHESWDWRTCKLCHHLTARPVQIDEWPDVIYEDILDADVLDVDPVTDIE